MYNLAQDDECIEEYCQNVWRCLRSYRIRHNFIMKYNDKNTVYV